MFCFAGRFDCSLSVENLMEQMRVPLTRTNALLVHNWVLMIGSHIIVAVVSLSTVCCSGHSIVHVNNTTHLQSDDVAFV